MDTPSGAAGGVPVKAGNMPVATVAANAVNAASKEGMAFGDSNAVVNAPVSVAAASLTVVEVGTTPEA